MKAKLYNVPRFPNNIIRLEKMIFLCYQGILVLENLIYLNSDQLQYYWIFNILSCYY